MNYVCKLHWITIANTPTFSIANTIAIHRPVETQQVLFFISSISSISSIFSGNENSPTKLMIITTILKRHPNYFGEVLFWWGIFIIAASDMGGARSWAYFTVISPLFITVLILFVSGLPILEAGAHKRYRDHPEYTAYIEETSILIPLPNGLYRALPSWIKQTCLFEWEMYREVCDSSGVYMYESIVNDLRHGNFIGDRRGLFAGAARTRAARTRGWRPRRVEFGLSCDRSGVEFGLSCDRSGEQVRVKL